MASQFGIRGKQVRILLSLGGQRYDLQGVTNASVKPRQTVDMFQPSGQPLEETDLNHKGWDLEWTTRKGANVAHAIIDRILARKAAGQDREQLTVTWTETYGTTSTTYSYSEGDVVIEPSKFGSGDDAVEVSWKASLKYYQRVA
jgi:hypothetical protein